MYLGGKGEKREKKKEKKKKKKKKKNVDLIKNCLFRILNYLKKIEKGIKWVFWSQLVHIQQINFYIIVFQALLTPISIIFKFS